MNKKTWDRPANVKLRSFSKSLPMSLLLAREAVMQRFRTSLHLFNITEQQWRVLRALSSINEIEVTALAKVTYLLTPSLSRILKDIESRGYIIRRPAPDDMRRALISISPQGLTLIDAVAPYSEGIYGEIYNAFGKERMDLLQQLLKELTETLNALPPITYTGAELSPELAAIAFGKSRRRQPVQEIEE
ncbi:homoprotocatechuate degradation operon regulator HpaR [Mesorhizobium australicum]|jgi:homoprotocatechuate degradation regulator HpaR|uniref:Transcriptional regulator, MarR family n=2 Tax=Mesorhizobium TaxID=68287 RepID=A0A1X7PQ16_9HYPH|nr:homoprotocatechuate degradation operon regulator HpaR [Mesorhizobium australicum]SMH54107.1 transcriptional regulator, MarR family [Mesorhizobium australicum]